MNPSKKHIPRRAQSLQETAGLWEQHWSDVRKDRRPFYRTGIAGHLERFLKRAGSAELIYSIIRNELSSARLTLEAGCGTGYLSLRLALKDKRTVLLDTSPSALEIAGQQAGQAGLTVSLVKGSVLNLPFKEGVFDACFNVGVLDHFDHDNRKNAASEMVRVVTRQSPAVIVTNDARSMIHPKAMDFARKKGTWPHGYKDAIRSFRSIITEMQESISLIEYSRGFISQFEFLHYFLSNRFLKATFFRLYYVISFPFGFLNRLPGQYLVTVIKRGTKA